MNSGHCDGLALAFAGVHRMNFDGLIREKLNPDNFIPAVGQGSIAVESSMAMDIAKKHLIMEAVSDKPTEVCIRAERSFLRTLEGGCSIPVFGLAQIIEETSIKLRAGIISLDGSKEVKMERIGSIDHPEDLGQNLAEDILAAGGEIILKEIRAQL